MRSQRALTAGRFSALVALLAVVLLGQPSSPAVATFPGVHDQIAFQTSRDGDYEVYVMNPDGTGQTNLTNSPSSDTSPAWSPNGSRIAFVSDRDGEPDIYVMGADGSSVTRLAQFSGNESQPAWSPDGSQIAFVSDRDGTPELNNQEIYVMNADGSGQTNLTNNQAGDVSPAWSLDGSKIAFGSARDGFGVYVMNADGSGVTRLTQGIDGLPAWSPDGSKIAYAHFQGSDSEIYVMNAAGSEETRLTNDPAWDEDPAWSPDGSKIAFVSFPPPEVWPRFYEIHTMNADGSDRSLLIARATAPSWGYGDSDGDGCGDMQEALANPMRGGLRDPNSTWDYIDQYSGSPLERDRVVAVGDIGALVGRFGTNGDPNGDPLVPPAASSDYHTSADRSGSIPGQDPWDLLPPDGNISVGDIGAVVGQFGHSCA